MDTLDNCDFDWFYENLSEGQKQHLANRLYKRDGIVPQQLKQHKDTPVPPLYPAGSRFEDNNGREYMLSLMGDKAGQMGLINTRTGYPYKGPLTCLRSDTATVDELRLMGPESGLYHKVAGAHGDKFERVW